MKKGKISESVLKRTIIKEIKYKNKAVKKGAAVGNDGAVFAGDGRDMVSAVAAHCGDIVLSGKCSFAEAVNSIAAKKARAFAVQVSVLMPESTKESQLRNLMIALHDMGEPLGIQISGGHTETVSYILQPVVTVISYGYLEVPYSDSEIKSLGAGLDIVMIGEAGIGGTAVLAHMRESELRERFTAGYINQAKEYADELLIAHEAAVAVQHGGRAMHDTAKGGVFGALWELCEYLKCGMEVNLRDIPIRQETVELCEHFDYNPYLIESLGALLVVTDNGEALANAMRGMRKPAAVIGKTVEGHQKTVINNDEKRYLESPRAGKPEENLSE